MRTRLKVHFDDLGLEQSMDALGYMCEKHGDQIRKNGEQYIAHPLSMACMFQCLKIKNDDIFATLLLHDVIEESAPADVRLLTSEVAKLAEDLPVGATVKAAVRLMTLSRAYLGESDYEMKLRYFQQLIDEDKPENKIATIGKGLDRWNNITTMTELSKRAIRKNVLETSILLLPVLKKAKTKWPRAIYFGTYGRGVFMNMKYVTDTINEIVEPQDYVPVAIPTVHSIGNNSVKLFPNPVFDEAHMVLNVTAAGNGEMRVYDLNGRLVMRRNLGHISEGEHGYTIDCNGLAKGMYLVNVFVSGHTATAKMIVR